MGPGGHARPRRVRRIMSRSDPTTAFQSLILNLHGFTQTITNGLQARVFIFETGFNFLISACLAFRTAFFFTLDFAFGKTFLVTSLKTFFFRLLADKINLFCGEVSGACCTPDIFNQFFCALFTLAMCGADDFAALI